MTSPATKRPGAVIFDVDGTLVDSVAAHAQAWQRALRHFGHPISLRRIRQQIGKGGDQLMPVFLSRAEVHQQGKAIETCRNRIFRSDFLGGVKPFPRVRTLFLKLRAEGWKIGIASSSDRRDLAILLRRCRVQRLAEVIVSSDDAARSKPHPDIFRAAMSKLRVKASECWAVGDSPYDAEAAKGVKLRMIGLLSGGFSRRSLRLAGAKEVVADPAALLRRYDDLLGSAQR